MDSKHPVAVDRLPGFITTPGQTDVLFVITTILLIAAVLGVGVLYLRLHALPEQIAHRTRKVQFEIVAVLALLALFTHNHLFWIAGLLLAFIELPDFASPINSMARSLDRLAGQGDGIRAPAAPDAPVASSVPAAEGSPAPAAPTPQASTSAGPQRPGSGPQAPV